MPFYDRVDELGALDATWRADGPQWLVLSGRRGVGKTALLSRFLDGKPGVLFEASEGTERDLLADLSRELASAGLRHLANAPLTTWRSAFDALDQFVAGRRAVIAIDRYARLRRATPEIGRLLETWWRDRGQGGLVRLVLSGARPADHPQRTREIHVTPFGPEITAHYFPNWTPENRLRAYAVLGGTPHCLEQFDPRRTLAENILAVVLSREGVLREETRLILHESLPEPTPHFGVLRALANDANRISEIVHQTGLEQGVVIRALDTLRGMTLVQRVVPVTEADSGGGGRRTRYRIAEPYLHFWFRFVLPHQSRIETPEQTERHLWDTVLPELDELVMRSIFRRAARAYVARVEGGATVGEWWGRARTQSSARPEERYLPVVAIDGDGRVRALASCRWTNQPLDFREEALLTRLEPYIPGADHAPRHYFFSRSGFSPPLERLAASDPDRYRLVTAADLFAPD